MKALKAIWNWLNGKKTNIGATAEAVVLWLVVTGKVDQDTAQLLTTFVTIWVGGGLAHKGVKAVAK